MREWIEWAMKEGFLGEKLTPSSIFEAMIKTVMKGEVDDSLLSAATGIDSSIWSRTCNKIKQLKDMSVTKPDWSGFGYYSKF